MSRRLLAELRRKVEDLELENAELKRRVGMISVALITTVAPERCGLREYSENLVKNAELDHSDVRVTQIGRPFDQSLLHRTRNFDVVHVNHVNALFGALLPQHIHEMKRRGQKTLCTFNDSSTENRSQFTLAFDRTVVHQRTVDGFQYVKHGIPWKIMEPYRGVHSDFIATSGFPFEFKNYPLAARLASAVGKKLWAVIPDSPHVKAEPVKRAIEKYCPGSVVDTSYPSHDSILDTFSQCAFSLFPYRHETTGIGGSARVGIGAQRPVVITNVIRFLDLITEYKDEYYVIEDANPSFETALPTVERVARDVALGTEKIPYRSFRDMNWRRIASEYVQIYRELMNR